MHKIIHYCWFGNNPLPPLALKCIASWKEFLPEYEIKEWNEDNFDVNIIPYTAEAYAAGKYAFVSDYARFWILYNYGGVYFDTDVEIIKPIDDILKRGAFMGAQGHCNGILCGQKEPGINLTVAPGLGLAVESGHPLLKELLSMYDGERYVTDDGAVNNKTIVYYTTIVLARHGLKKDTDEIQCVDGIYIYPEEYFNPISIITERMHITPNTRSIHWFMASWKKLSLKESFVRFIRKLIPEKILLIHHNFKYRNK